MDVIEPQLVTGVARDQLIGSDFSDYLPIPKAERATGMSLEVLSKIILWPYGMVRVCTDVLYNATVYRNEAERFKGFCSRPDVTERNDRKGS